MEVVNMYSIKRFFALCLISFLTIGASMAEDAVFSEAPAQNIQNVNIEPATDASVKAEVVNAVNTETSGQSLSNEKFKSAVNNIESAQVDVREQLAAYKALVDEKTTEVAQKKAELSKLKSEYRALQKKMDSIEKMKKLLNDNINQ